MSESALTKSRKRRWLAPAIGALVLVAAGAAGFNYWRTQHAATASEPAVSTPAAPVFYALDTFTVNLGDADRVLYIGITLRLPDERTRQRFSDYLPEVRSRLLLLFSRQNASELASEQGKQALVAAIKSTLAPPLIAGQPEQKVNDVLYTAFILR